MITPGAQRAGGLGARLIFVCDRAVRRKRANAVALVVLAGCGGPATAPHAPPAPARSVLLITIDTLRADRLGCYGDAQARTPRIDALAADGTVFDRAFTPVPITLPAHASLFTGLIPPAHGVRGNGAFALGPRIATLAEAFTAEGRSTAAFVGGFPLARRFGLDRGFGHYDDRMGKTPGVHYEFAERRADAVVDAAIAWLASHPGETFVWVHLFDPHAPYDPPPAFAGDDAYRGEIAAVDAAAGRLLDAWDARPGPNVVALTADHGEAFGEHGEESHSLFVYDVTLRVPLLLRGSGVPAGRQARPVSIVDLGATLLSLAGAPGRIPGASLLGSADASRALYAETLAPRLDFGWSELRSIRSGGKKLIRAPRPELYDVEADPGETRDLAATQPDAVTRLSAELDSFLAAAGEAQSRRAVEPETAERLRSLGYVEGMARGGTGADPKDKVRVALRIAHATGPFRDHAEAVAVYRAIAALDPDIPVVNFRLADALLRSGKASKSVPYFVKVIDAGPRTADPFVGLATAYATLGRLEDATRTLTAALRVEPASGQAHFNLGEIARVRGDRAAARTAYQAALGDPVTRDRAQARLQQLP
jgi:choline-sulfatase